MAARPTLHFPTRTDQPNETQCKANQTQTKPQIQPTYRTPIQPQIQSNPPNPTPTFKYSDSEARYSVSSITRSLRVLIFPSVVSNIRGFSAGNLRKGGGGRKIGPKRQSNLKKKTKPGNNKLISFFLFLGG